MKKATKRKLAAVLSGVMLATAVFPGTGFVQKASAAPAETILFKSSFEADDGNTLIENTVDGTRSKNTNGVIYEAIAGDLSGKVDMTHITGSTNFNDNESKQKLFDNNPDTKFLTSSSTAVVFFNLSEAAVVGTYYINSANDEPARDPKSWTLEGSNDNSVWTVIDTQTNQTFSDRKTKKTYTIPANSTAYTYYKFSVTQNNGAGMTQFADLTLGTGIAASSATSVMQSQRSNGPASTWVGSANTGWSGSKALKMAGSIIAAGEGYSNNVIYDNLNIPVTANTNLSYMIFPGLANPSSFDNDYTSHYSAVDIKFKDGTYLSQLNALDQYGNILSAREQGDSKVLYSMQWNHIESNIGKVATGKTIEKILVTFNKPTNTTANKLFVVNFDDIIINTKDAVEYDHLSDYVNTLRGSTSSDAFSRGLLVPFATMPHGFNQFVPVTNSNSNKAYSYQQSSGHGLAHISVNHFSSNWVAEYGTWQFMINTSINQASATTGASINADARKAAFSHDNEKATAHYYGVKFNDDDTKAPGAKIELSPTEHGAYVQYTFPESSNPEIASYRNVIFDCERANGGLEYSADGKTFKAYSDHTNNGSTRMYVYGEFTEAPTAKKVLGGKQGIASFAAGTGEKTVGMKFATSFISYDQAKANMELEISNTDTFNTIYTKAQSTWDELLGTVEVEGATFDQMTTLYSNMYRLFSYPMNYSENTGTNENEIWQYKSPYGSHNVKSGKLYTINGFWDTYRTTWAAYALLTPTKDTELLNGLVQHYLDQGRIPRWMAPGGTASMVGTSSDVIFGDAAAKGIDFDMENALKASLVNASVNLGNSDANLTPGGRRGTDTAVFNGYANNTFRISDNESHAEGFSWSMESYTSDWGISQLAKALGKTDESNYYLNRSLGYTNLFNDHFGWFMGRTSTGAFRLSNNDSFNPSDWGWGGDYTETNGWNMAFSVTQDGQGLASLYGGRDNLAAKLDSLFDAPNSANHDGSIHEMREAREVRMGVYGHSNQPSHHIPYMYNYAGQPWKTQEKVREVMQRLYTGSDIGQGYCGDEDNGEMSGWYIFSALGFYPTNMGSDEYSIGSPLFTKATVHLEGGDLTINAPNNSKENIYIQSVKMDGTAYNKSYFKHADLADGGTIDFVMGSEPSAWGSDAGALPSSITKGNVAASSAYQKDLTTPATTQAAVLASTSAEHFVAQTTYQATAKNLIDNTSNTEATFSETTNDIAFGGKTTNKVVMYTLTSGKDKSKAPTSFTLSASNDNITWTALDARSGISFDWNLYTRPFYIDKAKQGDYKYYKLTLSGPESMTLSEVEFISAAEVTQAAPTGLVGAAANSGETNGKITGVTSEMEYSTSATGSYTAVTGTEITGIAAGTYYVRYKAVDAIPASAPVSVTVKENPIGIEPKYDIDHIRRIVKNVTHSTSLADFKAAFDQPITVYDRDGKELTSGNIAGKMTLKVDGTGESYAIWVKGDINNDGEIDITDMVTVRNVLIGVETREDFVERSYVNDDRERDIADLLAVKNIITS